MDSQNIESFPGRERIPDPLPVPDRILALKTTGEEGFARWMIATLLMASDKFDHGWSTELDRMIIYLCESRIVSAIELIWLWRYLSKPTNCQWVFQLPGVWTPYFNTRDHEWWRNTLEFVETHASDWLNLDDKED